MELKGFFQAWSAPPPHPPPLADIFMYTLTRAVKLYILWTQAMQGKTDVTILDHFLGRKVS